MKLLATRLERLGFCVDNWGYNSLVGSVEQHAIRLRRHLQNYEDTGTTFHIVAHSMGCVIVRASHEIEPIVNQGRVVFLTPPHHGSPVARCASGVLGWCVPVLYQLSDAEGSFVRKLPSPKDMEFSELTAEYDILVPNSSTHLFGERDYATVKGTHASNLFSTQTATMISSFLQTGRFDDFKGNSLRH